MKHAVLESVSRAGAVHRGRVVRVSGGEIWVEVDGEGPFPCEALEAAAPRLREARQGDAVLVVLPAQEGARGCVIGTVASAPSGAEASAVSETHVVRARDIVLEAGERIVLRVGESQITITGEGRITIEGRSILSRARGVNRIRGAAVSIN